MITLTEFEKIDKEVIDSINELLDLVKAKSLHYVLFLSNGEYMPSLYQTRLNPYTIDSMEANAIDRTRREFFSSYMTEMYSFPNKASVASNINGIQLELMIYTHIWESKNFIRTLKRLSVLADGKCYPWSVTVPWSGKEDYIRNDIRDTFKKLGLKISEVMTKSFNSSLRNAFAHSDYYIRQEMNDIRLTNYTGKSYQLKNISFADWRIKFAYSALLSHHLLNLIYSRRINVCSEFGTNKFLIMHPTSPNSFKARYIYYHTATDYFTFHA
jgi:hypothetical protein